MPDTMFLLQLVLRYMHILGAIMLMGATIFMRFALHPAVMESGESGASVAMSARARWAKWAGIATGLLLLSGLANLGINGAMFEFPTFRQYNMIAGIKFLLALPIFFLAALLVGKSNLAKKVQSNAEMWLNVNLVLALIMVLIGGGLRYADRRPKRGKPTPPAIGRFLETHDNLATRKSAGESTVLAPLVASGRGN